MPAKVIAHRKRRSTFQQSDNYASTLQSEQIWESLNQLLAIAANPIFEYTEYGINLCLSLLAASMDKRRKVSIFNSDQCRGILTHAMLFNSGAEVLDTLQKIGVERNLIVDPLMDALTLNELPAKMLPHSPFTEDALIRHLRQGLSPYLEFRQQVSERYIKLADSQGRTNAWVKGQGGLISDPGEHANNYMLSVFRAIDKFYPHRGTLANYVMRWMENAAGSNFNVYLGEAFVVPRSHRRQSVDKGSESLGNFSLPLEEAVLIPEIPHTEDHRDNMRILGGLYNISVLFPAMLELDLPVVLSEKDIQAIKSADNVSFIPTDLSRHLFSVHHAAVIAENINFNNKRDKRRKQ